MQGRTEFLLDFDGTLTDSDGQTTITSELYNDLKQQPSLPFGADNILKSPEEMLIILRQKFGVQGEKDNPRTKQRLSKEALDFLLEMTASPHQQKAGLVIISRNYASYISAMIQYEFMAANFSEVEANVRLQQITIFERATNKAASAKIYLQSAYPTGAPQVVRVVDDSQSDGIAMEEGAREYFQSRGETPVIIRHVKDEEFRWDLFRAELSAN